MAKKTVLKRTLDADKRVRHSVLLMPDEDEFVRKNLQVNRETKESFSFNVAIRRMIREKMTAAGL